VANMTETRSKLFMPPRNLVGTLVPTFVAVWYFLDKIGNVIELRIAIIVIALAIPVIVALVSTRTRKTRRAFFWRIYDVLTGDGRLPLRLFVNGMLIIAIIALGLEFSGLQRIGGVPSSFITRYVEVNLYWTVLNFLGMSDNSIEAIGFSKVWTIFAAGCGLLFWGMYISLLVNKYSEMRDLFVRNASLSELDGVLYNEPTPAHNNPTIPQKSKFLEVEQNTSSSQAASLMHQVNIASNKRTDRELLTMLFAVSGFVFWIATITIALIKSSSSKE